MALPPFSSSGRSYSRSWSSVVWGGYQLTVQAEELVRKVSEVLDDWRSAELELLGILGDSGAD
ncbi:MAG TPA: hypothetical protein VLR47_08360 [Rhodospirillales bacterium]|nr:hypothetical protein [Rhodospirillales bacterium]